MSPRLLTPGMLMDVSESRLDILRRAGTEDERRIVNRLLEQPSAYRRWGAFHYPLMRNIAASRDRREQLVRLRQTNFTLLHRQALFAHLRDGRIAGRDRDTLIRACYGQTDVTRAVITEHRHFLESNSSLFCADYVEMNVMRDAVFAEGFEQYGRQYMEYFSLYCDWVVAESQGVDYLMQPILVDMKRQLSRSAAQLIALPEHQAERRLVSRRWPSSRPRRRPTGAAVA